MSDLLIRTERALTYALSCSLGIGLKPKFHRGAESPLDLEAIEVLKELRASIGIKTSVTPVALAQTVNQEDWSAPKKAPQY